jgi:hypothetical protein
MRGDKEMSPWESQGWRRRRRNDKTAAFMPHTRNIPPLRCVDGLSGNEKS